MFVELRAHEGVGKVGIRRSAEGEAGNAVSFRGRKKPSGTCSRTALGAGTGACGKVMASRTSGITCVSLPIRDHPEKGWCGGGDCYRKHRVFARGCQMDGDREQARMLDAVG